MDGVGVSLHHNGLTEQHHRLRRRGCPHRPNSERLYSTHRPNSERKTVSVVNAVRVGSMTTASSQRAEHTGASLAPKSSTPHSRRDTQLTHRSNGRLNTTLSDGALGPIEGA